MPQVTTELIREVKDGVLTLTINRPERRNAMSPAVIDGLTTAFAEADSNPDIRCIVLTGAGDKAFCSGADLQTGKSFVFDYATPTIAYANLLRRTRACCVPIIARVNGACMAGGMGLLAMADMAVASPHATFGLPEVKVGVFPMQVLSVLQHLIPERILNEMCVTGDPINAGQALELRLINHVADPLDQKVEALVASIMRNSPTAIRRGLYTMKRIKNMSFEESMSFTESQIGLLSMTEDAREGLQAFVDKRKPVWTGR
jgi:enoyl-CoA hydratase/carnithine racemase